MNDPSLWLTVQVYLVKTEDDRFKGLVRTTTSAGIEDEETRDFGDWNEALDTAKVIARQSVDLFC